VDADVSTQVSVGKKFYKGELSGIPLRIEVGERDVLKNQLVIANRVTKEKIQLPFDFSDGIVDEHTNMEQLVDNLEDILKATQRFMVRNY